MHLGQHDLCQMDFDYLRSLSPEALVAVSERLLQDLKEAHERLAQDPTNSSKPPSSQPAYLGRPWGGDESDRGEEADPTPPHRVDNALYDEATDEGPQEPTEAGDEAAEPQAPVPSKASAEVSARRPGKPPGAPGYGRTRPGSPKSIAPRPGQRAALRFWPVPRLWLGKDFTDWTSRLETLTERGGVFPVPCILTGRPSASVAIGPAPCLPQGSAPEVRGASHRPP
jgi:hypothetical protein